MPASPTSRAGVNAGGRLLGVLIALSCAGVGPAHAAVITATFHGTLSTFAGGDGRVRAGDAFAGVLTLDSSYGYNRRIDSDRARFFWAAWDPYLGPPPVTPPPLPVYIGFENLRTGEHFDVPVPGAAYDYNARIAPYSTIGFATGTYGQRLELGSFLQVLPDPVSAYWTAATVSLAGAEDALFDGFATELITARPGSVIPALSFARYATEGIDFTLALSDFGFGPQATVSEPGGLGLLALGLFALAVAGRRPRDEGAVRTSAWTLLGSSASARAMSAAPRSGSPTSASAPPK